MYIFYSLPTTVETTCGHSLVGKAQPCRGFESRCPLHLKASGRKLFSYPTANPGIILNSSRPKSELESSSVEKTFDHNVNVLLKRDNPCERLGEVPPKQATMPGESGTDGGKTNEREQRHYFRAGRFRQPRVDGTGQRTRRGVCGPAYEHEHLAGN